MTSSPKIAYYDVRLSGTSTRLTDGGVRRGRAAAAAAASACRGAAAAASASGDGSGCVCAGPHRDGTASIRIGGDNRIHLDIGNQHFRCGIRESPFTERNTVGAYKHRAEVGEQMITGCNSPTRFALCVGGAAALSYLLLTARALSARLTNTRFGVRAVWAPHTCPHDTTLRPSG